MDNRIYKQEKGIIKPADLTDWLIAHGISTVTAAECAHLFGVPQNEVPQRLLRQRSKGNLISLAKGLWAPVPPEYRTMGAPEPIGYMESLMNHYESEYCVGWLSAASLHGAKHQAPQVFQVATEKMIRDKTIGRSKIEFYQRAYIDLIPKQRLSTSAGSVMVASPGATMLMVASDLVIAGGIDNSATIIAELAEDHPDYMSDILTCAKLFSDTALCRLGWILEHIAGEENLDEMEKVCGGKGKRHYLSPYGSKSGLVNERWSIIENRRIEADI